VVDIDSATPTVVVDFVNSITQEFVTGLPSWCESASSVQRGFSFVNVVVTPNGVSGSNSAGTISFDWSFGDDGETLSGAIRHTPVGYFEFNGTAQLSLQVLSAEAQLAALVETVLSMNIQAGIGNALDRKLQNALSALDHAQAGDLASAAGILYAFIQSVEAQRGKRLTEEQSDQLVAAAQAIIDTLAGP
jgi:hypothetical protein